ncbi:hypothetical protein RclHR1_00170029 [Rhizophagus clarus]|uniref:Uncharacterized protein n=1 Tax=Rhizophagus clarus TaxID=94130 RepID=A0A2Z6QKC3_9GLOM|nr:hypothetical protein RclHR1_00170029 [Rhizophagus clarus]
MSKDKYQKQMAGFYQLDLIFYADFKDVAVRTQLLISSGVLQIYNRWININIDRVIHVTQRLHHSSSNESSSSQLSDSALEENRSCFKQVFNLNKEVGDTMDYAFETVRCEICELTGKKIGKGTVKSFYYGEGDSKFNIVMSIMRWVDDKEITNSLNNNNASSTNNLECDKNRDSEIYGQWDFFLVIKLILCT